MQITPRRPINRVMKTTSSQPRRLTGRPKRRTPAPASAGVAGIPLPEGLSRDQVTIVETGDTYTTRSKGQKRYLENE